MELVAFSSAESPPVSSESSGTCDGTKLAPAWPLKKVWTAEHGRIGAHDALLKCIHCGTQPLGARTRCERRTTANIARTIFHENRSEPLMVSAGSRTRIDHGGAVGRRCVAIDRSVALRSCECTSAIDEPAGQPAKYLCQTGHSGSAPSLKKAYATVPLQLVRHTAPATHRPSRTSQARVSKDTIEK